MKKFFQPEIKKFILPIFFVIIFFYTLSAFSGMGHVLDKNTPDIITFLTELIDEVDENNLTLNDVIPQVRDFFEPINSELDQYKGPAISTSLSFLRTLNPLTPLPCEITTSPYCRYYMQKDNYELLHQTFVAQTLLAKSVPPEQFSNVTILDYAINIIILVIEGYIISAIILFLYRRSRKMPWYKRIFRRKR